MIPSTVTAAHILRAIEKIAGEDMPKNRESRDFDLVLDDGRRFPPKYVVAVASFLATGSRLDSESFGGGDETNGFLHKLGFTVLKKAASLAPRTSEAASSASPVAARSTGATAAGSVMVDRVWMGLGISRARFALLGDPWVAHKKLIADQFIADPSAYVERIHAIGRVSEGRFLHLPACALVTGRGVSVADYRLPPAATVVAGRYDLDRRKETLVVLCAGAIVEEIDDSNVLAMDEVDCGLMVAISSTVGVLNGDRAPAQSLRAPFRPGKPVVVLDSGHHPYSSRYLFNTLRCCAAGASQRAEAPAVVVLSSWRYANAHFTKNWCRPEERVGVGESVQITSEDQLDRLTVSLTPRV